MLALACKAPDQERITLQFNCDGLIDSQIKWLAHNASVKKFTTVGNFNEATEMSQNQVDWKTELELFRALANINKPIYRNTYSISVAPDPKSNLTIKSWLANGHAPIRSLKVYYLERPDEIKKIEATLEEKNFIFTSTKIIDMEFNVMSEIPKLERYKISGVQQFLFDKPNPFSVVGDVLEK